MLFDIINKKELRIMFNKLEIFVQDFFVARGYFCIQGVFPFV